ncbi:MAG: class I SAM-dependent methyltransferase [bacterium]|nr:class I SAM-dependent methyltransferase [bacterium]
MSENEFDSKWASALKGKNREERSVFVPLNQTPKTQRQFVLFHQFEYIKKIAEKHNVKKAVEIGCGRGTMALYLNRYLGVEVTATDISKEAIELAKENFLMHKGVGDFVEADAANLPFEDKSFDMTVSIGLLEHLPDYSNLLKEQYRVLKDGGIMISVNIPKKRSIQIMNHFYRFVLSLFRPAKPLKKDYYRNGDSPKTYVLAAEKVGFREVNTFYSNSFPLFTPIASLKTERVISFVYNLIYRLRAIFMRYPFKGSKFLSQEHFLIAKK